MLDKTTPGPIVLFGSGEILPTSGKAHEYIAQRLDIGSRVTILETPAGFEPNSARVAGNVGDFLEQRLQNYRLKIDIIPARKKGTLFSPDREEIVDPILAAKWIFMGPGSPTYAVRQLQDSIAWKYIQAMHRTGIPITLASAAILAISAHTLPVYEIYKVGEELHWKKGLNLFESYGLDLIFIPHWNNTDGGTELDTSRCYMGKDRFSELLKLLPEEPRHIIGIDEHTALIFDFDDDCAQVMGNGSVTIINQNQEINYRSGEKFDLHSLGDYQIPELDFMVSDQIIRKMQSQRYEVQEVSPEIPGEILELLELRNSARQNKDWQKADALRSQIQNAGWEIQDTPDGTALIWIEA